MGQAVCCLRPSKSNRQEQPQKNRREDKKMLLKVDKSMRTLEECLKNSPAVNPRKRVYPSASSPDLGKTPFYTPGMSFSGKMEKEACKSNKKVTFRLPEEDDIILFYSPVQTND